MNTLPAGYKMSDTAVSRLEGTFMLYRINGWTDEQMIEHGLIELINPKKTVADVWEYYKGVWPDNSNYMYWDSSDPFTQSNAICNRIQFEQYGRNRNAEAFKTANAMVEKFEAAKKAAKKRAKEELEQIDNAILRSDQKLKALQTDLNKSREENNFIQKESRILQRVAIAHKVHVNSLTCERNFLQTELDKVRGDNDIARKESRILQLVAVEHKAIIARHQEQDEITNEANDHLRYMDKQQSKELKKQELSHIAKNTTIKQLQTEQAERSHENNALNNAVKYHQRLNEKDSEEINGLRIKLRELKMGNRARAIASRELKKQEQSLTEQCHSSSIRLKVVTSKLQEEAKKLGAEKVKNTNKDRLLEEQKAEIAHLKEVNTHGHNANYQLQEEVKKLVINKRNLNGRVSSQANELDQLHSMYSEQAERCNEITAIKLNLEKTIQNLTALTGTKEPKNDD
jgi:hypothetical protein